MSKVFETVSLYFYSRSRVKVEKEDVLTIVFVYGSFFVYD